jgi:tryptophanyl-tRNA synthetase
VKRILSGIKPSGEVTLGNYLGAMKRWAELQQRGGDDYFYFVPNLHALTARPKPEQLLQNTLSAVAWLLALGIDYKRSTVFVQSQIPAHSELCWILDNFVTMGELSRMTQYKDKSQKMGSDGQYVGLFNYPVLMAADILLYDADEVPVGDDQKQHVELAREIAERFNNIYGPVFKMPKAVIQDTGARIMDLQNPLNKMSKSDQDERGYILMVDPPDVIRDKIKRAVTDSGSEIKAGEDKPALSNLLSIYSLLSGKETGYIEESYAGKGYAEFKSDLGNLIVEAVGALQNKHDGIMKDRSELISIIDVGRRRAAEVAEQKVAQVKLKLGLI